MADLTASSEVVRANLQRARAEIEQACAAAGRDPSTVQICAATKYVDTAGMESLREAGLKIAGENRLQDLAAKQDRFRDDFEWHFIGAIQSRKMREIAGRVDVVHSLASESARAKLADLPEPWPRLLVQVNVAHEEGKQGVAPEQLGEFIAGCPLPVSGLSTMPPAAEDPEAVRVHFRRLAELGAEHGLTELSMGTSQDFRVAVEEGATFVRIGSVLFRPHDQ